MRFQFSKTILLLAMSMAILLAYPLYAWGTVEVIRAIVASGVIALVNIILGCLTLEYAFDKSNQTFMFGVFGGMGIRMGLILIAFTILLINDFHALALSLSLMGFYVTFMIAEIIYAARELARRNPRSKPARQGADQRTSLRSISVEHRSN